MDDKQIVSSLHLMDLANSEPNEEKVAVSNIFCFAALANKQKGTIYTDPIGCFPMHSFKVMVYLLVMYCYDLNANISQAYEKLD